MTSATEVRERPILFSGEMIRAILEDRKTQTRRVVKVRPWWTLEGALPTRFEEEQYPQLASHAVGRGQYLLCNRVGDIGVHRAFCPIGKPGGRVWVRETLRGDGQPGNRRLGITRYGADGEMVLPRICCGMVVCECGQEGTRCDHVWDWKRPILPSIHMPRWASRITLEITDVRVQRLQDITPEDAIAEGATEWGQRENRESGRNVFNGRERDVPYLVNAYAELWNSLNAKRGFGWDVNPWVWVVGFKRLQVTP